MSAVFADLCSFFISLTVKHRLQLHQLYKFFYISQHPWYTIHVRRLVPSQFDSMNNINRFLKNARRCLAVSCSQRLLQSYQSSTVANSLP